jgi:hypothetical protein
MWTCLTTKFMHNSLVILALACVLVYGMSSARSTSADGSPVAVSPATIAAAHDCWSGDAPADMQGILPGHVVVTIDGRPRYAGERMVGKALEQVFEGADHGLTVHAFCR